MNKGLNKKYLQLIYLCFFAYMISYVGRLGYTTNIQNFIDTFNVTKLQAGYATSAFFFCYGAGQFINGAICERVNSGKMVAYALIISAIITVSLFFISNMIIIAVLWGANGLVLSALWCNLVKLASQIKEEGYKSKSVIIMSISLPVGTLIAYGVSSLLTGLGAWQIYFIISAVILFVGGIFFLISVNNIQNFITKNTAIEQFKQDEAKEKIDNAKTKASLFKFLAWAIVPVFFISVCGSLIKDGVQTWMPSFLNDNFSMPTYFSILITLILPLIGLLATVLATFVMKKCNDIFLSQLVIFAVAGVAFVPFILVGKVSAVIPVATFAVINLLTHTGNAVFTAILPIYYSRQIKSGMTAGIVNGFAYVGSALSSVLLGGVVDSFGWNVFTYILLGCVVFSVILSVVGYFLMKNKKRAV